MPLLKRYNHHNFSNLLHTLLSLSFEVLKRLQHLEIIQFLNFDPFCLGYSTFVSLQLLKFH